MRQTQTARRVATIEDSAVATRRKITARHPVRGLKPTATIARRYATEPHIRPRHHVAKKYFLFSTPAAFGSSVDQGDKVAAIGSQHLPI